MRNNKLGITNDQILSKIELQLIKLKLDLLSYEYTFNEFGFFLII